MWNLSPNDTYGLKFPFKIANKYFKIKLTSLTLTSPSYPSHKKKLGRSAIGKAVAKRCSNGAGVKYSYEFPVLYTKTNDVMT